MLKHRLYVKTYFQHFVFCAVLQKKGGASNKNTALKKVLYAIMCMNFAGNVILALVQIDQSISTDDFMSNVCPHLTNIVIFYCLKILPLLRPSR